MNQLLIRGATVFDGRSFIGSRDVLIEDDRVARVAERIQSEHANVIEATRMTLLPGLIDSHVHSFGESLVEAVTFGVTTVIDMFTSVEYMGSMKEEQNASRVTQRAEMIGAGNLATVPGGSRESVWSAD